MESLDQQLHEEFDTLRAARAELDREIEAWAEGLGAEELEAPFRFESVVQPRTRVFPLWFLVTHFFNHQTHHRGQLTTLLSQAGCEPGVTDLLWLPGAELPDQAAPPR